MARHDDAEHKLLQYSYEANRSATHHRTLHGEYSYEKILAVDLVQRCLAALERVRGTVRVLDIGCGDGSALRQLQQEMARRELGGRFEFFGLGMNRYPKMCIDTDHFIHSTINQYVHTGPPFDLVFSVFTWHYVWHKIEAIEKVYNHLLAPNGEAYIHFPGFLVAFDDDPAPAEESGNERFSRFVKSFSMLDRNPDIGFRLVPFTSDDEDGAHLGTFGVLHAIKSDKWLDCGLLYTGCELVSHGSGCVYVASAYLRRETLFGRAGSEKLTLTRKVTTSTDHIEQYLFHIKMDLCIHSQSSAQIIINYPGAGRNVDGIHGRFKAIAAELQDKFRVAMVRVNNPFIPNVDYPAMLVENLQFVIDYVLERAEAICGHSRPSLYLMGHSAGASAIGAVAAKYVEIEKILLLAPSWDAGKDEIRGGLCDFGGEVYIVIGMDDKVVLPVQSRFFYYVAGRAARRKCVAIWNCDHDFSGARNYDLLREAPRWAFLGSKEFPEDEDPFEPQDLIHR